MNSGFSRRDFLMGTAAALSARTLAGGAQPDQSPSERPGRAAGRPNVLWICTDQQRYDTIRALGNRHLHTPNLDRLVATGVAFTHAHCRSPICTPSRAAFLTGMYPDTVHACINGNDRWDDAAPLVTKTLAESGYDCALAGKLHLSAAHGRIEKRPDDGYREFWWSHHPADDWPKGHAYVEWLKSQGRDYRQLIGKHGYIPAPLHQTTWCAEMADRFIRANRDGAWLFSLNCFDPHPPFDPPKQYVDRFDVESLPGPLLRKSDLEAQARLGNVMFQSRPKEYPPHDARLHQAKYWAQIELIDENVGRLLATLDQTGQRENTIVIFTSDHGDMVGDHGLRAKGCRFYEGLVRVPLIISWPARFRQGLRSGALVELTDLVPTLLEVAGLPVPESMHGKSLLPILEGKADPNSHRESVRSIFYRTLQGSQSYATMIRDRRYKLVNYHGHGLGELFDLEDDPGEFRNLWDDPQYTEVRFELMTKSFDQQAFAVDIGTHRVGRY
ncbi:MAG: sulfatase family protein [Planctomycetota bacterium]|jgi:arylsulfatase A-like enzyme